MDLPALLNLIFSGIIAFIFGTLSTWLTYRNERKRDDLLWEREKEKLRDEIKQDLYKQREIVVRSEILPTIWRNLLDALGKLGVVTAFYREYPDLNNLSEEGLTEFLENSRLSETQRKQLVLAPDKTQFYIKTIFWYELDDAQKQFSTFHNHLLYNKIYLNDNLFEKLSEIDKELSQLINQSKVAHQYPSAYSEKIYQAYIEFNKKSEMLLKEIEKAIQHNLHS